MSNKAETNQALMNEIALLSRFLRNAPHTSTSTRLAHHQKFRANTPYQKTIPNQKVIVNSAYAHATPGFVPASALLPSPVVIPSREKNKRDLNNRYKIDRRAKSNTIQFPSIIHKSPSPVFLPKVNSPKKYEVIKKYFLKRTKSTSATSDAAGGYKKHSLTSPNGHEDKRHTHNVPTPVNSQRIASRVLQRSIHRLRTGNPICSYFKRFGKCWRQGVCPYLHVQHISQIGLRKDMIKFRAGLKPPCVFHARGGCATINCPFPHITPEEEKTEREKRKLREKEKRKALKPKRYYEEESAAPAEFISLVVARNNTRQIAAVDGGDSSDKTLPHTVSTSVPVPPEIDPRRERLMSKIALLKRRYGQSNGRPISEIPALEFLPFKK